MNGKFHKSMRCLLRLSVVALMYAAGGRMSAGAQLAARLPRLAGQDRQTLLALLETSMVRIPAGSFEMGSLSGKADERPPRQVYLDAYAIDQFEVTNLQYTEYLRAAGGIPPPYWINGSFPAGQELHPVVGISWQEADGYCRWAGKRLPSEAEWEKACRGSDARRYPWGSSWEPLRANTYPHETEESQGTARAWQAAWGYLSAAPAADSPGLTPVGSYPLGTSPYGVFDMAGNASEWAADWYSWEGYADLPETNPLGQGPPWNRSLRGSAWYDPAGGTEWARDSSRCSARSSSHHPSDPRLGFRCALSTAQTGAYP